MERSIIAKDIKSLMRICQTLLTILLACGLSALQGQSIETDLYLFKVAKDDMKYHVHSPKFLNGFNLGGYNNQPWFVKNDLLYLSVKLADSSQHDIFALDLENDSYYPVSQTPENEFSPRLVPNTNKLSYIRQNTASDEKDQQLYLFDNEDENGNRPLLPAQKDLGYYCWLEGNEVALYYDREPTRLAFADVLSKQVRIFGSDIGRCLATDDTGSLLYVHKYTEEYWYLKRYDAEQKRSEIVIQTIDRAEDFAVAPDGSIFQGSGSKLYVFNPTLGKEWVEVFDLAVFGIKNITRLAFNANFDLALVNVVETP